MKADFDDKDGQSVLFWYPAVTAPEAITSVPPSRSRPAPGPPWTRIAAPVTPYVAADLPGLDLAVRNVTTVRPERTFWDKVIILHGLRQ